PPASPLLPSTTLFRSDLDHDAVGVGTHGDGERTRVAVADGVSYRLFHRTAERGGDPGGHARPRNVELHVQLALMGRDHCGQHHRSEEHTSELQSLAYF